MRTNLIVAAIGALLLSSCLSLGIREAKTRNLYQSGEDITTDFHAYSAQYDNSYPYGGGPAEWQDVGNFVIGSKASKRITFLQVISSVPDQLAGYYAFDGEIKKEFIAFRTNDYEYDAYFRDPGQSLFSHEGTWILAGIPASFVTGLSISSSDHGKTFTGGISYGSHKLLPFRAQALN